MSDIDTAVVDSLKALDPGRPIREGDKFCNASISPLSTNNRLVRAGYNYVETSYLDMQ